MTPASQGALCQAPTRRFDSGGSGRLSRSAPCLLRPCCSCYLILQRKGADCGIASPVITALCGQNANRQSEHERRGGDDYAFGHHGSPLSFYVRVASVAVYSTAACDGCHELGEYGEIPPAAVSSPPQRDKAVATLRLA